MALRKRYAWGFRAGSGDGYESLKFATPRTNDTYSDWSSLSIGKGDTISAAFTIGIRNGELWSWGTNSSGRTGQGIGSGETLVPTKIGSDTDWESVSAGGAHSLAIKTTGTLWAWGGNTSSQLGLGDTTSRNSPTQIGSDTDWASVSAGSTHTLAIKDNGTLWVWGNNANGRTGLNTSSGTTTTPTQVGSDTDWESVSAGGSYSLAVKDGKLYSWGSASNNRLGNGTTSPDVLVPTQVGSDTDWESVSASFGGFAASFGIRGGRLFAWGLVNGGQLGLGNSVDQSTPTQVGSDTDWQQVSSGNRFTVAIKNNQLYAWGDESSPGANSDGALTNTPQLIDSNTWTFVANSQTSSVPAQAIRGGVRYSWPQFSGNGEPSTLTTPQEFETDEWEKISIGLQNTLAIRDGALWGWGGQRNGSLGNGVNNQYVTIYSPVQIGSDTDWTDVAAGKTSATNPFSLGIRDGKLFSWGSNQNGRGGRGAGSTVSTPTQVGSATDWSSVSAGDSHGAGLRNGALWVWGENGQGQLGDGTTTNRTSPVQIGSDTDWQQVVCLNAATAAIKNGALYTSGTAAAGRLGNNTTTPNVLSLTQIGVDTDWVELAAGDDFVLARKSNGTLWAWGSNGSGKTGNGTIGGNTLIPTQIGVATDWETISAGLGHSGGIRSGDLYMWGSNSSSQVGDNSTTNRSTPVKIGSSNKWVSVTLGGSTSFALEDAAVAPANTALPTIATTDDVLQVGSEMTSTDGSWDGYPAPSYAYQWQVSDDGSTSWANISGATSPTLTVPSSAGGKYIRLEVTATNSEGSASEPSAAVGPVALGIPEEGLVWHSSRVNGETPTEGLIYWPRIDKG